MLDFTQEKKHKNRQKAFLCSAIYLAGCWAGLIFALPATANKNDQAALRPLLLYQDGKRYMHRKGDPFQLLKLVDEIKSTYVIHVANQALADHYAITSNWEHYQQLKEYASPCAQFMYAIFNDVHRVAELGEAAQAESPKDRTCFAALNAATAAGFLRDDDIWRQMILLINSKKTSQARLLLPLLKDAKASRATLNKAVQQATARIKGKHALNTRVAQQLLAVSAVVAAQRNPRLAGQRWEQFAPYIDEDINEVVWPLIGTWASLDHHATEALSYFRKANLVGHNRLALAWRTRAAMRVGDWQEVVTTIAQMRGEQAGFSAWQYWQAHANYRLGHHEQAIAAWRKIAEEFDDYYGLLAGSHLGIQPQLGTATVSAELVAKLAQDADVRLAVQLGVTGRTVDARKVWKFLHARLDAASLLAIAEVARQRGWVLGAVNAADVAAPQASNPSLRFPTPLEDMILPLTQRFDLDPGFVYALIRRESRFNPHARSSAGARGLMQVMPATARAIANKYDYTRYQLSRLTMPGPNLLIGTRYLADLYRSQRRDLILIAASYNAGPHRVRKWLRSSPGVDKLVFIETIPFTETRLYVKSLLGVKEHYDLLFGIDTPPLHQRLAGRYS